MATVQTRINRALRLIGALPSGGTPTSDETADALIALNGMISGWNNDGLMVYSLQNISVTLIPNTATYTIGATGGTVATAPVTIETAIVRKSNIDYALKEITDQQYQYKQSKTVTATIPEEFMFNGTNPNATVTLYPTPSEANTLLLSVWTPFAAFSAATDSVAFPDGYEDLIDYNLAVNIHPEYPGLPLSQVVIERAKTTLANVKRINGKAPRQVSQLTELVGRGKKSSIYEG